MNSKQAIGMWTQPCGTHSSTSSSGCSCSTSSKDQQWFQEGWVSQDICSWMVFSLSHAWSVQTTWMRAVEKGRKYSGPPPWKKQGYGVVHVWMCACTDAVQILDNPGLKWFRFSLKWQQESRKSDIAISPPQKSNNNRVVKLQHRTRFLP